MNPYACRNHNAGSWRALICYAFAIALLPAVTSTSASAQVYTDTWTGGFSSGNWSSGANWAGGGPVSPTGTNYGENLLFAGTNTLSTNDINGLIEINSVTFNANAGAFTLGGNAIAIGDLSTATPAPGIINNSALTQTVSNSTVFLVSNQTWNAASGRLVITSTVTPTYSQYTSSLSDTITFAGAPGNGTTVSGSMQDDSADGIKLAITVSSTGDVTLSGANTYSGATILQQGGVINLSSGGSLSGTAITSSATFSEDAASKISGASSLTVSGGTTTLNGTNTYSGALNVGAAGTIGGTGASHSGSFTINGSVLVGDGTDTTSSLTLTGTGSNTIANAKLQFNISAATPGQGNTLYVGASTIAFSGSTLALDVSGVGVIPADSPYVLIAGTGTNQYSGLMTQDELVGGRNLDVITGGLSLTFAPALANTWYAQNSFLYINTANGVDDIDVAVVPEPSTWALLVSSLVLMLLRVRPAAVGRLLCAMSLKAFRLSGNRRI